jgi:hypothetical protein
LKIEIDLGKEEEEKESTLNKDKIRMKERTSVLLCCVYCNNGG